ncbi:FAD synthetase 1, chloroplastic-like [Tasmannia lanceolata]|uniref:FAD synthetase 1, chloroplastic-like n=1 Tax=Tasmannia lanceolata TaxID=3420 RepID=UPI004062A2E6
MEGRCRISNFLRGYDPSSCLKFPICLYIPCRKFFPKPSKFGEKRLQRLLSCCPKAPHRKNPLVADSFSQQENDRDLLSEGVCPVTGGIVALGKFDALHIGHRELAVQASKAGVPFLLSFVGMAEVLGWESRAPIVAKCDRKRVLSSWASYCGNVVPLEFHVEFSSVRHLTPRQFVERLSNELRVNGVVAGENYRFGYKALGDASELVSLCKEYGLGAYIVSSVMDKNLCSSNEVNKINDSREKGQVSSTRVRRALATGDVKYVSELLGRKHRLMLMMNQECVVTRTRISAPKLCMLNQPPKEGVYEYCTVVVDDMFVGACKAMIDMTHIHVELDIGDSQMWVPFQDCQSVGIEFGGPGGD